MFVLCGGLGTRLRDKVGELPKSLAPIGHIPFLQFILEHWVQNKITNFVFLLGYKSDLIINYLEEVNTSIFSDCHFDYVVEAKPLGTGGAVANAIIQLEFEGNFFLINSDTWLGAELDIFLEAESPCLGLIHLENTERYGRVEMDESKRILSFTEKNPSKNAGFINSGLYLFHSELFQEWDGNPSSLEKHYLVKFAKKGILNGLELNSSFIDIGIPKDYEFFKKNYQRIINETL